MSYALSVSADQAKIIAAALGRMPFEVVASLILHLQAQITAQDAQRAAEARAAADAAKPDAGGGAQEQKAA